MKKVIILVATFFVSVCVFSETVIKLGYSVNQTSPRGIASQLFKSTVEKKTKNKIKVEIYDDAKLGSDPQLIEGIVKGTVDMTISSAGNFASLSPKLGVSALPFLFSDFEKAWKFMDSEIVTEINKDLEKSNIVVLSHFDNGFRCVTTTNKQINSVSDMKGLKIRTPENIVIIEVMRALGANPSALDFAKLPDALKAGRFDSQENPIQVIYNSKLYEYQKYLAITNHSYDAMPFVIRKDLWDSLSKSEQKILKDAAVQAQNLNRTMVKEQSENLVANLKKAGMIITYPDLKEFAEATKHVLDAFSNDYGQDLIDKVKAFAK